MTAGAATLPAQGAGPVLAIAPSVPVWRDGEQLVFDRKFFDGMAVYARLWPGRVRCLMSQAQAPRPVFGLVARQPAETPFECVVRPAGSTIGAEQLQGAAVLLAAGDVPDQLGLAARCRQLGVKCVHIIEYTPDIRLTINRLDPVNRLRKAWRGWRIRREERQRLAAFALGHGLQVNGTAAWDAYRHFANPLLYFDTRVYRHQLIEEDALARRLARLATGQPLRLAFSGRLIAMKGAEHLMYLAQVLRQRGVAFHLTVYGDGEQVPFMRDFLARHDLAAQVTLAGAVDFDTELLPAVQREVDLFVMLHRQSDPSCTYLETLSCGVPIVGYDNAAFAGILDLARVGWGAPLDDFAAVADIIERLDRDRQAIAQKARAALAFARHHTFEATFAQRVDQLKALASDGTPDAPEAGG
jgi:glycosyltransferase involved in cell wall biosynthesis